MQPTKKLGILLAATAALGLISACHNSNPSSPARAGNQAVAQAAPANTDAIAAQSGPVNFLGYAHEDDSPMTADELAKTVADVPAIGADYNKLQTAAQAQINADGTITLTDSAGNAIDVTAADTTIRSYTFAAVQDSAAAPAYDVAPGADAAAAGQAQAQAQAQQQTQETCAAQRLVFDLSGTEQPAASQEQAQAQAQAQEEKKELKTRAMHVYLLMPCQEVKQEAKQEQVESKAIAPEAKQESKEIQESKVPAQESKAPAQESKAPAQVQQPK